MPVREPMTLRKPTSGTIAALLALGLIAVAAGGCGRRSALLAPNSEAAIKERNASAKADGAATGTQTAEDASDDRDEVSQAGTAATSTPLQTSKGARRGYSVPKQPFFLDPIL